MDKEVGRYRVREKERKKNADQGGIEWGGEGGGPPPPKSPFVTLGFQFPGKEQPPPPVLN